jgi:glycosyltransferase involved in cell wall biosynthesis
MRWGMNARRLSGQRMGVGRYIEYLLKHWNQQRAADDRFTLFVRTPFHRDELGLSEAFDVRLLRPSLTGILWENVHLPRHAADVDVLFCPNYSAPLAYRGRLVVAIHSVNEIQPGAHRWWYPYTYGELYRRSALMADRVIVPTDTTKHDVERYYGLPAERMEVVEQGTDDTFRPIQDAAVLSSTRRKYLGVDAPYVLFVGTLSERRNTANLLRGFANAKKRGRFPHKLLLFGPNPHGIPIGALAQSLGIENDVVQTDGRIGGHADIVPVYCAADVFVHPSLYEGFSMTTVEALACGVAVIASNRGGLADVANGYARMLADPTAEAIGDAIYEVLSDSTLRQTLQEKALVRATVFRWENTARKTMDVLRRVAA